MSSDVRLHKTLVLLKTTIDGLTDNSGGTLESYKFSQRIRDTIIISKNFFSTEEETEDLQDTKIIRDVTLRDLEDLCGRIFASGKVSGLNTASQLIGVILTELQE